MALESTLESNVARQLPAARWHWQHAGDANNWAIGEWQVSRVYAVLQRWEPAQYHARICLRITVESTLRPFLLGFAHEAMARALAGTDATSAETHRALALAIAQAVDDAEERRVLESDLSTIVIQHRGAPGLTEHA